MIKRLIAPLILELHCISLLIYYIDMQCNPMDYKLVNWAVYFHCCQVLFLALFNVSFVFINKKSILDNQFFIIESGLSTMLFVAYLFQGMGIIVHTYGLIIAIVAILITTFLIIFSGIRHGIFNIK